MNLFYFIYIYLLLICKDIHATDVTSDRTFKKLQSISNNNNMIGVASVAGIISQNDRYSSIGGIQFINPFLSSQNNVRNMNKNNQAIASGYIEMRPGSVTASSSKSIGNGSHKQTPWSTFNPMPWPINPYLHARDLTRQRNIEEWLHRDIFENLAPNMQMHNGWMYPTFDPFINY